jgi:ferredoxin-NADP reductase
MKLAKWLAAPAADVAAPGRARLNMVRGVVARVTTPLLPDDYLRLVNPLWTARELRGRVVEVRRETADSATLVIKPGWGFDFDYHAGQYIGIGVRVNGRWHWRSYSLTSPPRRGRGDRTVSIAVKAMPEGFLSSHLVAGVPEGTIVRLASPAGDFRLPDPPPSRILFLTAGSGVTPVIGMLRTMRRRGQATDVAHIHSAPSRADVMFGDELARYQREFPGYRHHLQLTRSEGKFALARLDDLVPDWRERHTWACGPAAMLDTVEEHWRAHGDPDRLHTERFDPGFRRDEQGRVAGTAGGTVTFRQSGRSVAVDGATTLLQAGESIGVGVPFGCRMGICRTCVVTLTDGAAVDLRSGAEYRAGEKVQTCVCAAAGDCTVDC